MLYSQQSLVRNLMLYIPDKLVSPRSNNRIIFVRIKQLKYNNVEILVSCNIIACFKINRGGCHKYDTCDKRRRDDCIATYGAAFESFETMYWAYTCYTDWTLAELDRHVGQAMGTPSIIYLVLIVCIGMLNLWQSAYHYELKLDCLTCNPNMNNVYNVTHFGGSVNNTK